MLNKSRYLGENGQKPQRKNKHLATSSVILIISYDTGTDLLFSATNISANSFVLNTLHRTVHKPWNSISRGT